LFPIRTLLKKEDHAFYRRGLFIILEILNKLKKEVLRTKIMRFVEKIFRKIRLFSSNIQIFTNFLHHIGDFILFLLYNKGVKEFVERRKKCKFLKR
jgi:hypothetical protein